MNFWSSGGRRRADGDEHSIRDTLYNDNGPPSFVKLSFSRTILKLVYSGGEQLPVIIDFHLLRAGWQEWWRVWDKWDR